jgi:hypothetical protein
MKKNSTVFLQVVVVILGIFVLSFLLWEPHFEGRNIGATAYEIYFRDPFLIYAYTASISFFVALYQIFKILKLVGENNVFSLATLKAVKIIKYCGMIIAGFVLGAEAYLFLAQPGDDIAGGVFMGLLLIFGSGMVAIIARMFERIVQNAIDEKSV